MRRAASKRLGPTTQKEGIEDYEWKWKLLENDTKKRVAKNEPNSAIAQLIDKYRQILIIYVRIIMRSLTLTDYKWNTIYVWSTYIWEETGLLSLSSSSWYCSAY